MKRFLTLLFTFLVLTVSASAQTPAETIIGKYDGQKGVKTFVAKDALMSMARGYIRKSPMGPLADSVDEVTIMMMKRAGEQTKAAFLVDLRSVLADRYMFYGKKPGMDGRIVEVYGSPIKNGAVDELIVFNSELYSLFSLRGSYPVEELKKLDK